MRHTCFFRALAATAVALLSGTALAQAGNFPTRPITLMVGYQPGGSVDLVARSIAPSLSRRLGQPVVIENMPGAGGTLAAAKVVAAERDGYTLLLGSPSEVGINHLTNAKLRYRPDRDLQPIGLIGSQPMVLVASSKVPVKTSAEFIDFVSRQPGKMMYASSGIGTPLHLAGEMINQKAGVSVVHVPYRGAASMTTDLLGGQIDFGVFVLSSALPFIQDGRMKPIGVTSVARSEAAPNIPALGEHPRLAGIDINIYFGVLAPSGIPPAVAERIRSALKASVKEPELRKKLQEAGVTLNEDADFPRFLAAEIEKFKRVVEFAHISE